ncbi:MAG: DUF6134 family protein [Gammaproteobacteria bacterium]|jgi:hypothetical protein
MPFRLIAKAFPSLVHLTLSACQPLFVRCVLIAFAGAILSSLMPAPVQGIECKLPSDLQRLEYEIQWMGEPVGELVIVFDREGELLTVHNTIDVDARIFSHSLFRFTHVSEEQWHQGSLIDFQGVTVDNGERRMVRVSPQATTLYVDGKGGPYEVPRDTPLLSAWCKESIASSKVIEPTKGRIKSVTARMLSSPSMRPGRQQPLSSRFRIGGDLHAEIWYDSRGIVTFARFPVKGGTMGALVLTVP